MPPCHPTNSVKALKANTVDAGVLTEIHETVHVKLKTADEKIQNVSPVNSCFTETSE